MEKLFHGKKYQTKWEQFLALKRLNFQKVPNLYFSLSHKWITNLMFIVYKENYQNIVPQRGLISWKKQKPVLLFFCKNIKECLSLSTEFILFFKSQMGYKFEVCCSQSVKENYQNIVFTLFILIRDLISRKDQKLDQLLFIRITNIRISKNNVLPDTFERRPIHRPIFKLSSFVDQ